MAATAFSTGNIATLGSGSGNKTLCYNSLSDGGKVQVFYLYNLDATNFAVFTVSGMPGITMVDNNGYQGKIYVPPLTGVPIRCGQVGAGIQTIYGWGEDPTQAPVAGVKAIGFVMGRF